MDFICYTSEAIEVASQPLASTYAFAASMVVPRESQAESVPCRLGGSDVEVKRRDCMVHGPASQPMTGKRSGGSRGER